MDVAAALAALKAAGTAQNRKIYTRHGAPAPLFGVSFAVLRGMGKQLGIDHALARELWASGNTDARCLATLVGDPTRLDADVADAWATATRYHVLADLVAELVSRSPLAIDRMSQWVASTDEWVARCGWAVMSQLATKQPDVPDAAFTPYLTIIERRIHDAPNRAREAMNGALIAIGSRSAELAAPALAAARRIGPVEVDHGETGCQTFEAVSDIQKARAHAEGKAKPAAKAKAKATPTPTPTPTRRR